MSELAKRLISAAVLIPVALFITLWDNPLPFAVAIYFIILLGNSEVVQIFQKAGEPVSKPLIWIGALAVPVCFQFSERWMLFGFAVAILIILAFLFKMFSQNPVEDTIRYVSVNTFAAIFFPFFMSFLWLIRIFPDGGLWIIFVFVTIWCSDSCAYFAGKRFGRRKVVPKISPKKSLEGFIAGFIGGVAAALIYYYLFLHAGTSFPLWKILIISGDVVVAGMIGDLFESMLKRNANVKDSGNVIPGHGGILDRADSVLFAAPVLYIYLRIFIGN